MQSAVLATAIPSVRRLSVCQSVCPPHAGIVLKRMKIGSRGLHCEIAKHSNFLIPTTVAGRHPFPPKICAQSDPTPSEKRRLRVMSAYNVSTVRASEKVQLSRIGSRPHASQRAIDEVGKLPKSPPKSGSKSKFVIFVISISLNRINSAIKFLCVKTSSSSVVAEPLPCLLVYICWR